MITRKIDVSDFEKKLEVIFKIFHIFRNLSLEKFRYTDGEKCAWVETSHEVHSVQLMQYELKV